MTASTGFLFEHRCAAPSCDRRTGHRALLFKGRMSGTIEVKCTKCKAMNRVEATSSGGLTAWVL